MTRDEFVKAIKRETSDSAVRGTISWLNKPAGRQPARTKVELSKWFTGLAEDDKRRVEQIVRQAAELAVFNFLSLLDGMSFIDDGRDKGNVELYYLKGHERLLVNDPQSEYLHDIYNSQLI